jgi:hypothetical protein
MMGRLVLVSFLLAADTPLPAVLAMAGIVIMYRTDLTDKLIGPQDCYLIVFSLETLAGI